MLQHEIENQDFVMQVQLLNLLKVIIFQSGFREGQDNRKYVTSILAGKMFVPVLMNGLFTEIPYVRIQFINFISLCIPILSEFLEPGELTNSIKSLLVSYYEIVQILQKEEEEDNNNDVGISDSQLYDSFTGEQLMQENVKERFVTSNKRELQKRRTLIFNTKKTLDKKEQPITSPEVVEIRMSTVIQEANKHREEESTRKKPELKTSNPFSKRQQNKSEVLTLLDGVKQILNFFLKLKPIVG
jgi:hypothetical protein